VIVLGIDPGPETSGVVVYDVLTQHDPIAYVNKAATESDIRGLFSKWAEHAHVVIEQPACMGPLGAGKVGHMLNTAWQAGRFSADAEAFCGANRVHTMTRREVLRELGVLSGTGSADSRVRGTRGRAQVGAGAAVRRHFARMASAGAGPGVAGDSGR
jgi:hypothetical protein